MTQWSHDELRKVSFITGEIARSMSPRRQRRAVSPLRLSLRAALPLLEGLGGGVRALLVRQLLRSLGFDEYSHVEWRLEHKLVQALVLQEYLPGLIPVTRGLSSASSDPMAGWIVKPALGDSSGESRAGRVASNSRGIPLPHPGAPPRELVDEQYIIQQRVPIAQEYRVHTLEESVIEDLTFRRYGAGSIPGERDVPNAFVQSALDRLPDALVGGSLLAWDVSLKPDREFAVIEVNFSGFHPVFKRGFHCSGYYHDYNWGACDTARLLNHVARVENVEVEVHADAPEYPELNRFYRDTAAWQKRHPAARVSRGAGVAE